MSGPTKLLSGLRLGAKRKVSTLYVVSSWELPHVFSAFGITSAPSVVEVNEGNVKVFVEHPKIYDYFTLKDQTPRDRGFPSDQLSIILKSSLLSLVYKSFRLLTITAK